MHVWSSGLMGPLEEWECENEKENKCTPFTICWAEIASFACFWWLGALSKMNRACASPFVRPLKMLIMWLTWASRWSAVNHPSLFFPGQKMIWALLPPGVGECEWDQRTRPATVHLLSSHKHTQSAVKKSETIREMPSPFAFGISLPRHPNESAIDHFDKMWICHVWWEQDGSAQEKDEGAHFLRCPKCEIDICRF